jgi:protein SDA1
LWLIQKLEEEAGISGLDAEEKVKRAEDITQNRILTQEEFQKIRVRNVAKTMGPDKKGRKRKSQEDSQKESGEIIQLDDIEKIHKKRRHDYESRLETVMVNLIFNSVHVSVKIFDSMLGL